MAVLLRLPEPLHDLARIAAATKRQSLHAWMLAAIRAAILQQARGRGGAPVAAALKTYTLTKEEEG